MNDYVELFLSDKSERTRKLYRGTIKQMLKYINKDIKDIERIDIVSYKATLGNLSTATQANRIATVKSYFDFLYMNEIIESNPASRVMSPRITNKPKDSITVDEAIRLMEFANPREKAVIAVLLNTGIRVQELIDIKLDDYTRNPREMTLKTKGNKYRKIVLGDDAINLVNDYLQIRKQGCDNLFVGNQGHALTPENLNNTWKKLARKAGIEKHITNHSFRSTFVTTVAKEHGLLFAQICVGHSDISTTRRYVRGIDDEALEIMRNLKVC